MVSSFASFLFNPIHSFHYFLMCNSTDHHLSIHLAKNSSTSTPPPDLIERSPSPIFFECSQNFDTSSQISEPSLSLPSAPYTFEDTLALQVEDTIQGNVPRDESLVTTTTSIDSSQRKFFSLLDICDICSLVSTSFSPFSVFPYALCSSLVLQPFISYLLIHLKVFPKVPLLSKLLVKLRTRFKVTPFGTNPSFPLVLLSAYRKVSSFLFIPR
jgi:hypothetical protein